VVKRAPASRNELFALLETVMDPEVPVLSIVDLGIVRDAVATDEGAVVTITPTYSGCPAMREIETEIRRALEAQGIEKVEIRTTYSPAWTTDWMSDAARAKLEAYGIAPPGRNEATELIPLRRRAASIRCPYCKSVQTEEKSVFGSTACKSIWFCNNCQQPFEQFKAI
jgi:ring-1,2-phenylacetyl-CoA epoxidase subunit PaaD